MRQNGYAGATTLPKVEYNSFSGIIFESKDYVGNKQLIRIRMV